MTVFVEGSTFDTVLSAAVAIQRFVPSNASAYALAPTATVAVTVFVPEMSGRAPEADIQIDNREHRLQHGSQNRRRWPRQPTRSSASVQPGDRAVSMNDERTGTGHTFK